MFSWKKIRDNYIQLYPVTWQFINIKSCVKNKNKIKQDIKFHFNYLSNTINGW